MKKLKVSIITVCYNSAKTIEKTIQSVVNQSYDNIEYIIIDGKSTDETLNIIHRYRNNISCLVSEMDRGIYDAMNKGIKIASGDIIGIINSDDWYSLDAVKQVVHCFMKSATDVVHGNMVIVDENGKELGEKKFKSLEASYLTTIYSHPTVFIRKEVYIKCGDFNAKYKIAADYDLTLRLAEQNMKFTYLPKTIAYFRQGGVSTVRNKWKCGIETRNILYKRRKNFLQRKDFFILETIDRFIATYRMDVIKKYLKERIIRKNNKSYAIQFLLEKQKSKYIIWGTGFVGSECLQWFRKDLELVDCFIDNNTNRQGNVVNNILVKSYKNVVLTDKIILIASIDYYDEIKNQLQNMGLKVGANFLSFKDFQIQEIREYTKLF